MKIETYQDNKGEWRWRARSSNGNILATSGEGYVNYADMVKAINHLRGGFPLAMMVSVDGDS